MRYKFEGFAKGREGLIKKFARHGLPYKKYIDELDYCIENSQVFVVDNFPYNCKKQYYKTREELFEILTNLPFSVCCFEPLDHSWCIGEIEEDVIIDAVMITADKSKNIDCWVLKSDGAIVPVNEESLKGDYDDGTTNISNKCHHVLNCHSVYFG